MSVRAIAMLAAAAGAAVACAGHSSPPTPVRGPGYDPQRAALQAWTEDSAILRTGPHRGQMIAFALDRGCISTLKMEVGQGKICPVRLRRFLPADSSAPNVTRWREEPLDELPGLWSSDTSVLLVAANGSLVARRPGSAIVRASVREATWLMYVDVYPAIESFHWEPASATLRIAETIRFRTVVRDTSGQEMPVRAQVNAYGGTPGMVRVDSAPGWRELAVHAIAPGHFTIRAGYAARSATASITVLSDSESKAIAKRTADSVSAFLTSRLPAIRVRVVDDASRAPVVGARVEATEWKLAAATDANGVVSILGGRAGTASLVVRCPWQRRVGPVAATRTATLRPTSDTSLVVAISRAECAEVDSRAVSGEFAGHVLAVSGARIFAPCTPFDSLAPPPGVKRPTARVVVVDTLLRGRPPISNDPLFVRWSGIVEGPGPYDDLSSMAPYRLTVTAVSEMRPAMVGDCRR